jgi:hypothetical protein
VGFEAKHGREIMCLGGFKPDRGAHPKRLVDVEARAAKIVSRHGVTFAYLLNEVPLA